MNEVSAFGAREILAALLFAAAAVALLAGAIGQFRFPDVFARAHAAAVLGGAGGALLLAALAVEAWDARFTARLALLAGAALFAGPIATHLAVAGAHAAGAAPVIGRLAGKARAQ